jgi:hypothetical protein
MSIIETQDYIEELRKTLSWIDSIVDEQLRDELEIHIDEPPTEIRELLLEKTYAVQDELAYYTKQLKQAMDSPLITIRNSK